MLETINNFLATVNDLVWGTPLMILIIAGGILLTVRMGVLQIRKLPLALKWMVNNEDDGEGEVIRMKNWKSNPTGGVYVQWDNGDKNVYRYGAENCYDVIVYILSSI